MRRALALIQLTFVALVIGVPTAHAAPIAIADFQGPYAIANWTVGGSVFGQVLTGGAPASIQLIEPDSDLQGSFFSETTFTTTALASGTFSFDWTMSTSDACCSGLNVFIVTEALVFGGGGCNGDWAGCSPSYPTCPEQLARP